MKAQLQNPAPEKKLQYENSCFYKEKDQAAPEFEPLPFAAVNPAPSVQYSYGIKTLQDFKDNMHSLLWKALDNKR